MNILSNAKIVKSIQIIATFATVNVICVKKVDASRIKFAYMPLIVVVHLLKYAMRFAYLITSYNNFQVLQTLIGYLDDQRNDIYVHFDKRVSKIPELNTEKSRLFIIDKRIDVRWGTYSQIQSYFELYRESNKYGPYDFYHLISGTTLPVKTQDYLHSYLERYRGASLVRFWKKDDGESEFKIRRIHFLIDNFQSKNVFLRWITQHIWTLNMFIQVKLGIRINKDEDLVKTDSWVSLSESAVAYLLIHEDEIHQRYRFSFAGDEYYVASELKKDASQILISCQNLLFVNFPTNEPHPIDLNNEDYQRLINTEYLFARKFTDSSFLSDNPG